MENMEKNTKNISDMKNIKFYDFDLGLPAAERWCAVFDAYAADLDDLSSKLRSILNQFGMVSTLIKPLYTFSPKSYMLHTDEIAYVAKRIGMTSFEVLLLQLIYETSSACTTSVLKVGTKEFFFRTMDWPMLFLKDITIGLNIKKDNKYIGKVTTWLGYVGFLTATNTIHDYTIAVNYRRTQDISIMTLVRNLYRTVSMKWPIGYLVRNIIENSANIVDAKNLLETCELISPCYVTVYVPYHQSYIITRDCDKTVDTRSNELVQTNCDWNKTEPDILWSLDRVKLVKITQEIIDKYMIPPSPYEILDLLLKYPVLNDETIYVHCQYNNMYETFI